MISTELKIRLIEEGDITTDSLQELGRMHLEYVRYSRDTSLTVPQMFDVVKAVLSNPNLPFQFWILKDDTGIHGFGLTELNLGGEGLELNIAQAYLAPGFRGYEMQKMAIDAFEEYARARQCVMITSVTRRDPVGAYIKWMGRVGFKKRWVVMEKDLRRH